LVLFDKKILLTKYEKKRYASYQFEDAILELEEMMSKYGHVQVISDLLDVIAHKRVRKTLITEPDTQYNAEENKVLNGVVQALRHELRVRVGILGRKRIPINIPEIQISYSNPIPPRHRVTVSRSEDAYEILMDVWNKENLELLEDFHALFLNRGNAVIGHYHVGKGGRAGVVVDAATIYGLALKANAQSVLVAHNHPSMRLQPSDADRKMTRELVDIGKLMKIPLLDHLVVTREGFYSFADEGEL